MFLSFSFTDGSRRSYLFIGRLLLPPKPNELFLSLSSTKVIFFVSLSQIDYLYVTDCNGSYLVGTRL